MIFWVVAALLIGYLFWKLFIKKWTVGVSETDSEFSQQHQHIRVGKHRRKLGNNVPPCYPSGWYSLCYSWELPIGASKYCQVLGENLVVFRGENGKPKVLDAYCPHLGANLGVGGTVIGNCIQCPFHGWKFNGDSGKCTEIPYSDQKIPESAKLNAWKVTERNSMVLFWFDPDGREPWEIPTIDQIENGSYQSHAIFEHHLHTHIQELQENAADLAHFNFLHQNVKDWLPLLKHQWKADWKPSEEYPHRAHLNLVQDVTCLGWTIPGSSARGQITQHGPGVGIIELHTSLGYFVVLQTITPLAPMRILIRHAMMGPNRLWARFASKVMIDGFYTQFSADNPIHQFRTFVANPILVKNDGPIGNFRRWFSQFYAKHKTDLPRDLLDW